MISLSLLAVAVIGLSPSNGKSNTLYIELAALRAQGIKVASQYGSLTPIDAKQGKYRLTLKPGADPHQTLRALRKDRRISLAWSKTDPLTREQEMQSVSHVRTAFDLIKPSRQEVLEELAEGRKEEREARKEKGEDYLGGYLYFISRRAYPFDKMDWSAYGRALNHAALMPAFSPGAKHDSLPSMGGTSAPAGARWQFLGPKNLTFPYQWGFGLGPGSGRVNAAAYDPTAVGTWYAGGAEGGLWKTTNNGVSWTPLGDAWQYICVSSIAVDPKSSKTIYVGTGDFPGWQSFSEGVMKSINGGATWQTLGQSQFGGSCVSSVLVDPDNDQIVTVTTGDGGYNVEAPGQVWRSTNGGTNWTPAIATTAEWSDASISLTDGSSRHYYVSGYSGSTSYLERSDNQGVSWTALTAPSGLNTGAYQIKASAVDPKTVYFLAPNSQKVYKSTDMGQTWTDISGNLPAIGDWGQSDYDYYLTVGKNGSADDLFVGLIDVFEMTGSATWSSVIHAYSGNDLTHVDQHCLTINPANSNDILVGNDGGIYHGTRSGSAWTFSSLNKPMGITQFYDGTWSATNPRLMLGGAQDNGTPLANGDLNNWGDVIGGDGFFVGMNPINNNIQYGTVYFDTVVGTEDGWQTSYGMSPNIGSGEPAPFVTIIQQDPVNAQYLYCTTNYLYRWNNTAQSWTNHLGGAPLSNGAVIHCVSVAPSNGNTIYTGSDDGQIFVSRDGGTTFTNINAPSLPNRAISAISVDRSNPNSILVGLSGTGSAHLLQCTNTLVSSPTYSSVSGGLPDISLNCIDRDQGGQASTWYAGTDIGVFVTINGGRTWQNATTPLGLPSVQVTAIQTTKYGTVNVATYGRGMWSLPVGAVGGSSQAPNTVEALTGRFTNVPLTVNGFIQQLTSDDNVLLGMSSASSAAAQAQAATMEADFNLGSGHTLGGASFSITTSCNVPATMQLFLFNYQTGRYDDISNYPSTTTLTNTVVTLNVSNPAVYMNAAGQVKANFRALSPNRNGSPFQMAYDSFTISPSLN